MRPLAILALLAPLLAESAPLSPEPAACTSALIDAVRADLRGREARVGALAKRARSEKSLFIDEVRAALLRPNDGLLRDPALPGRDPFSFASRLEALRPRLAKGHWEKGVGLWADWLERTEAAWERVDAAEYCGLREEGRSFAQDGYLMFLPFVSAAKGDDSLVPVAHFAAASGVISLGLDVVTFVPNVALSAAKKLSKNAHVRRSARAFSRFAAFVEAREKDPGIIPN
jgi:hypothetical protein